MPEKNQLSIVWHELYDQAIETSDIITRQQVQLRLGATISNKVTLECLRSYQKEDLIECIQKDKNGEDSVISNPFKESDFDRIDVTEKGSARGANYFP